ncbi:hypothetical protein HWV62_28495 [Athelia sp. TMB]|nr:hypothetical protein HWV62_26094 [Athelia sp. TMB]KAF7982398.1 hypothetical protein HWV62_28495 [Athelia sp. TMB]
MNPPNGVNINAKKFTISIAQLISPRELDGYIAMINADPPDLFFQHLLRGWMKFVAPLTPAKLEDVPRLKCVLDTAEPTLHIPESIFTLLHRVGYVISQFGTTTGGSQMPEKCVASFARGWPTMWIWIQHTYYAHQAAIRVLYRTITAAQKDFFTNRYHVFAKMFQCFINYADRPAISDIIENNPKIISMMAELWISEAKDAKAANGFSRFISGSFGETELAVERRFITEVILACGNAQEAVNVACLRVECNIRQGIPVYDTLMVDLLFFSNRLDKRTCPIGFAMHASARVTTMLMHTLTHLAASTALNKLARNYMIDASLTAVYKLLHPSPWAYERIVDLLQHNFIPLLIACGRLVHPAAQDYKRISLLFSWLRDDILSPATVHRKLVFLMKRSIEVAYAQSPKSLSDEDALIKDFVGQLWCRINERVTTYRDYKNEGLHPVILCGNTNHPSVRKSYHRNAPQMLILQNLAVLQSKVPESAMVQSQGAMQCDERRNQQ